MCKGEFWDAQDAADALVKSARYRRHAIEHLLTTLQRGESFVSRAAYRLLVEYELQDELAAEFKVCKGKHTADQRKALIDRLAQAVRQEFPGP
jgi:hypothetical protein